MSEFSDDIADGLAEIRDEIGVAVVYWRRSTDSTVDVDSAVRGNPTRRAADSHGAIHETQEETWRIGVDDLGFLPARNDEIRVTENGEALVWQVLPEDRNDDPFRYADAAKSEFVISTKLKTRT